MCYKLQLILVLGRFLPKKRRFQECCDFIARRYVVLAQNLACMPVKSTEALLTLFLQYLEQQKFEKPPYALYEPMAYIMALGGKRLRPVLTLMGCQLFGQAPEKALPAAMAVEIFHNFSLVHDDIMDQAPLRRGQPTVHIRYGLSAGILSGDVMLIEAYEYLSQCHDRAPMILLLKVFNRMAIEVCEGQAADMAFEQRTDVTLPEYLFMIEQKTAALIGAALHLGAIIGGASAQDQQHINLFGRMVGQAFQVQDDLLDTFGTADTFGKKTGGDIVQNKKTFLLLKALELADAPTRKQLEEYYRPEAAYPEEEKIEAVKQIFLHLGVEEAARQAKDALRNKALQHLAAVAASEERKAPLLAMADMLLYRNV